jgi:hypothetical protein
VELLLVAPQHIGPGLDNRLGQHVVQVYHLLTPLVSNDHEQGAVVGLDAVLHKRTDAAIHLLPHIWAFSRKVLSQHVAGLLDKEVHVKENVRLEEGDTKS